MEIKSSEFFRNMKTLPPVGSPEFKQLIDWEVEKCTGGVNINGVHISGWLYWHINHWWIRIDDTDKYGNDIRIEQLPELRDNEWIRAEHLENCKRERKGYMEIGGRQGGKDLLNSSLLYTPQGEITIGDCNIGDRIYDESGELTTITNKFPQGVKPVYKVTLVDGRELYCGLEHNWYVYHRKSKKYKVKTTSELLKDYKKVRLDWVGKRKNSNEFRYSIPNNNCVNYLEKELPIDPYIFGLWLGDGSNTYSKITNIDQEIIDSIYKYTSEIGMQVTLDDVDTFMITSGLMGGSKKLMKDKNPFHKYLKEQKLYNNKHIPFDYLHSSEEQRMELLRGLMDSDGSCSEKGSIEFSSSIPVLAENFYTLCRSLGINLSKTNKATSYKKNGIRIKCKEAVRFKLYTNKKIFKLTRKLERLRGNNKYLNNTAISNIEYVFDGETTCIVVDNSSHLFLTDNYTITHNSEMEASYFGMNAILFQNTQNVIVCGNDNDLSLLKDKVDFGMKKLWTGINIPRLDKTWRSNQIRLGYKRPDGEDEIWSYIIIRNAQDGNKTEVAAGTTAKSFIMDEVGKYSFSSAFTAAEPAFKGKNGWRAVPILVGTGGSFDHGKDAEAFFYNPDANNFLGLENPLTGKKTCLFLSGIYRQDCKELVPLDKWLILNGKLAPGEYPELNKIEINAANEEKARITIEKERTNKKANPDRTLYLKQIMYYPLTEDECFLSSQENMFDVEAAKRQKQRLLLQGRTGTPVVLYSDEEGVKHTFSDKLPISNFPLKQSDQKDAPVVIYEFPPENPPYGLYTAGCLLPGEKVLTSKGLKNVEEVSLNDFLINKEGKEVNIVNLQRYLKEEENVFTVKVSNSFRTTTFTKEHPIYVSDSFGNKAEPTIENRFKFDFTEAKNIKEGQWVKVPNIFKDENNFDLDILWDNYGHRKHRHFESPLNNSDFWWFVGLFLGDGWCTRGKVSVSFNKKETLHLERFSNIVKQLFFREVTKRERNNCVELTFSCKQLCNFLYFHFGEKADGKYIPTWAKKIENRFKQQLILGYLDSDGCVYHDKKRNYYSIEFVSISLQLLEDIQDVLFSLGFVSSNSLLRKEGERHISKKLSKIKETFHLRIGHNDTIKFISLFSDKGISHKLLKVDFSVLPFTVNSPKKGCFISECGNYIYFKITSIKKAEYSGWVYNFECDTHTYMCKNITTHNCDPYRQGKSAYSSSLGAVYIYKRMTSITGEDYQDMFVASYCARPDKKSTWEEQARLLIKYYNARTLCENDEMSFIDYMISKGDSHYLEKQPRWLTEIVPNTTVNRDFGIHRSADKIRSFLHGCIKKYMEEEIVIEKDDQGNIIKQVLGIHKVFDPVLLEEIIQFNDDLNTDRLVAAELAIALAMKMDPIYGKVAEEDSRVKALYSKKKKNTLFGESKGLFTSNKRRII